MNRRIAAASVAVIALVAAFVVCRSSSAPRGEAVAAAHTDEGQRDATPARAHRVAATPSLDVGDTSIPDRRIRRATATLATYLDATRYPPESRPLRERPDLARPHAVADVSVPLLGAAGASRKVSLRLSQDRYWVSGDEAVTLRIACSFEQRRAVCEDVTATMGSAPIAFEDAGDGSVEATFSVAALGVSATDGPLRVDARVRVEGEIGGASFELGWTERAPATFVSIAGERLEAGSLVLDARLAVEHAGRYVIRARVDDRSGHGFAFMSFNGIVAAGEQTIPLRVFGELVRDEAAESPFVVRDLEGFLLLEDAHPDRESMASRDGAIYTTRRYAIDDFADDVWESDQKARHVAELERSLE